MAKKKDLSMNEEGEEQNEGAYEDPADMAEDGPGPAIDRAVEEAEEPEDIVGVCEFCGETNDECACGGKSPCERCGEMLDECSCDDNGKNRTAWTGNTTDLRAKAKGIDSPADGPACFGIDDGISPAAQPVVREPVLVPMERIERCGINRKIDPESEDIKKLAADIGRNGLLNPIQLVPLRADGTDRDGLWKNTMIFAGERRYQACLHHLQWDIMPAYVREDLSIEEATELLLVDNLSQKHLTPMEEARGISELLARGSTPQQIADRLCMSVSWVVRRAKLTDLSEIWVTAAENPDGRIASWTASHFEVIARFEISVQDEMFRGLRVEQVSCGPWDRVPAGMTVSELKNFVDEYMMKLKSAPWKLGDGELYPAAGACANCTSRTATNPHLFDEDNIKDDRCLDVKCWHEKARRFEVIREAELREKYENLILIGGRGLSKADKANPFGRPVLPQCKFDTAKKSEKNAVPAFDVDKGTLKWVKLSYSGGRAVKSSQGAVTPLAERRKRLEKRRGMKYLDHILRMLQKEIEKPVFSSKVNDEQIIAAVYAFGSEMDEDILRVLGETKEKYGGVGIDERFKIYSKLVSNDYFANFDYKLLLKDIIRGIAEVMRDGISGWRYTREFEKWRFKMLDEVMHYFHQDPGPVKKQIEMDIPEPKSWKLLNEDGTKKTSLPAKSSGIS